MAHISFTVAVVVIVVPLETVVSRDILVVQILAVWVVHSVGFSETLVLRSCPNLIDEVRILMP